MKEAVTFIGNGNMALSIAKGLKSVFEIEVVGRSQDSLDKFEKDLGVFVKKALLDEFDISGKTIILCVKPANIQEVGLKLQGKCDELYSVLAGTTLEMLKHNIKSYHTVRAMPNLCASIGQSLTTLTGDVELQEKSLKLFESIGKTIWLSSEKELDIATAVAGSGPAYLALIHEAFCDGAVKQGMKRTDAVKVTDGLFRGFGELIDTTHSAQLKDAVMSPGGTTAAGYAALEKNGVRYGCIEAVEKAFEVTQKNK
ncbi:MAG: pyrroline-5-carboxylate reductase [Campylobacterales bacterium]|nr:pyrroline-5-carboxylate reductase [Campylobacterales bacterium]